ncbi:MAG: class I SAM-dependent methyltransferase [Elusimicrobia bacterium]|nr:class I SAM-dependent methyltransferase [Elusimicrobiota bacterium]
MIGEHGESRQKRSYVPRSFDPAIDYSRKQWKQWVKSFVYPAVLPVVSRMLAWYHKVELPEDIWIGGRGTEFDFLVHELAKRHELSGARLLLQGVGKASELCFWTAYGPRMIVGVDYFPERDQAVEERGGPYGGLSCRLVACDLGKMPFQDESMDGIASLNCYEHVMEIDVALKEAARVLKPGGWFLASLGPLYYAYGGDHLCGIRGGMEGGYNHLLLSARAYREFIAANLIPELDRRCGRPHFAECGLFNRLRHDEYRRRFQAHFEVELFRGHVDPEGLVFRRRFPLAWRALLDRGYSEVDLLVSHVVVMGRRRA